MKIKLVEDWKSAWRWFSVHSMILAAAVQGAWIYTPEDMRHSIPPGLVVGLTLVILACGVAGRLIDQPVKK